MGKNGFTVVELLIVVLIIGILAAISLPNFFNAQTRAKIAHAEASMNSYVTAIQMYDLDHNNWFPHSQAFGQNKYLTTPVAYVSSMPLDVFEDITISERYNWKYGEFHHETLWHYSGEPAFDHEVWFSNNPEMMQRAMRSQRFAFEVHSIGPNGQMDLGVHGIKGFTFYRISNGLYSIGDIVWLKP